MGIHQKKYLSAVCLDKLLLSLLVLEVNRYQVVLADEDRGHL